MQAPAFDTCSIGLPHLVTFLLMVMDILRVEGSSMLPSLSPGQVILVSKWPYGPRLPLTGRYLLHWKRVRRGDIIAYRNPVSGRTVVKRCIAALAADGTIPEGFVFAAGDGVETSLDSRHYGLIPITSIMGQVLNYSGGGRDGIGQ